MICRRRKKAAEYRPVKPVKPYFFRFDRTGAQKPHCSYGRLRYHYGAASPRSPKSGCMHFTHAPVGIPIAPKIYLFFLTVNRLSVGPLPIWPGAPPPARLSRRATSPRWARLRRDVTPPVHRRSGISKITCALLSCAF